MRLFAFLFGEAWKSQLGLFGAGPMPMLPKAGARPAPASKPAAPPAAPPRGQLGLFDFATAAHHTNDPSHGGKLHQETRTDEGGRTQTRWIAQQEIAAPAEKPATKEPAPPPGPPLALASEPPARSSKTSKTPGSRMEHKIEAGDHTWGSRKDLARPRTSGDLSLFSAAEQYQFVTKAALFTPMDMEQARADGKTPGYVILRHALEKAVAGRPEDKPEARAAYMDGLDFLAKSMDACHTAADLQEFTEEWRELAVGRYRLPGDFASEDEAREAIRKALGSEANNWTVKHESSVKKTSSGRWRAYPKSSEETNYSAMARALGPNLHAVVIDAGYEGWMTRGRNGWKPHREALQVARALDKLGIGWEDPRVVEAVEAATGKKPAAKRTETKEGEEAVAWGQFAANKAAGTTARRAGGRQFDHTSSSNMVAMFGLKNVQFGGWVSDDDAREHVKSATAALSDLADVLGIDAKTISLNGRLTLGLGARGKGGRASAHYEGWTKAINLTKWAGGGSLAHEWGHALDNVIAEHGATGGAEKYVSDGHAGGQRMGHMQPEVRAAFGGVMDAIYGPKKTRDREYQQRVARLNSDARIFGRSSPTYAKKYEEFKKWQTDNGYHLKFSNYFHDSDAFNGKSARGKDPDQGSQGYWTRPHELFARAFESYVQDRLESTGRANTYLVNGTLGGGKRGEMATGRFRDETAQARGEHAWPYPLGEDRQRINAAFDKLFQVLRDTGEIHKAVNEGFPMRARNLFVFLFGAEAAKAKAKGDNLTMDLFGGGSADPTHGGKLHAEKRTDKAGHTSTRYVLGTQAPGGRPPEPGGATAPPAPLPTEMQGKIAEHEAKADEHGQAAGNYSAGHPIGDKHNEAARAHEKAAHYLRRAGESPGMANVAGRLSEEAHARTRDVGAVQGRLAERDATRQAEDPAFAAAQANAQQRSPQGVGLTTQPPPAKGEQERRIIQQMKDRDAADASRKAENDRQLKAAEQRPSPRPALVGEADPADEKQAQVHEAARDQHSRQGLAAQQAGHHDLAKLHNDAAAAHHQAAAMVRSGRDSLDHEVAANRATQAAMSAAASATAAPKPAPTSEENAPIKWRRREGDEDTDPPRADPFRDHAAKEKEHKFAAAKHRAALQGATDRKTEDAHRAAMVAHKDAESAHAQASAAALRNPGGRGNQQLFEAAHAASAKAASASAAAPDPAASPPPAAPPAAPPKAAPSKVDKAAAVLHGILPAAGEPPQQLADVARHPKLRGHDWRHIEKAAQLLHKQGKARVAGSMIMRMGDGGQTQAQADAETFNRQQGAADRLMRS